MIFEGAADEVDAIGNQRRGQRVTLKAAIEAAIEGERQWLAPIDAAACRQTHGPAHDAISGRGWPALYVARILSLTVSRRQLKKRPHPLVWRQRSAWMPLGFFRR